MKQIDKLIINSPYEEPKAEVKVTGGGGDCSGGGCSSSGGGSVGDDGGGDDKTSQRTGQTE